MDRHDIYLVVILIGLIITLITMRRKKLAWKPSTAFFTVWASIIFGVGMAICHFILFPDYLYGALMVANFVVLFFCSITGHVNAVNKTYVFKITHFNTEENRTYGEIVLNKTPHKAYYEGTTFTVGENPIVEIYKEAEKCFWVKPVEC